MQREIKTHGIEEIIDDRVSALFFCHCGAGDHDVGNHATWCRRFYRGGARAACLAVAKVVVEECCRAVCVACHDDEKPARPFPMSLATNARVEWSHVWREGNRLRLTPGIIWGPCDAEGIRALAAHDPNGEKGR